MGAEHAKMTKKGFTLVELVVVIAILAIIAAIAIPIVSNIIGSANSNTDANNAKSIELTLKEANSLIDVGITSFYTNGTNTTVKEVLIITALSLIQYRRTVAMFGLKGSLRLMWSRKPQLRAQAI